MTTPLWSIVTLGTEFVVSGFVYFIIYDAYRNETFHRRTAFSVLAYEALFNISYMLSRALAGTDNGTALILTPYETAVAIFHGTFSLLMFLTLVAFFVSAARAYARGESYFRVHPRLTLAFSIAWFVSVLSGAVFFFYLYIR